MATNVKVSSSDWVDLRTRGYTSGMYLLNAVGAAIEYSTAATPVPGTTLVGSSAVLISGTYLWVRGSGDCELYTASEWAAANVKKEPLLVSTSSDGGVGIPSIGGVPAAGDRFRIILAAGQSNSRGADTPSSGLDVFGDGVYQYSSYPSSSSYRTIISGAGAHEIPEGVLSVLSPAHWLAKTYSRMTGCPVLIVPCGFGSTTLVGSRWAAGSPGGDLYEAAIDQTNRAIAAAKLIYPNSSFDGFYWIQGENDGDNGTSQSVYAAALKAVIAGFRGRITDAAESWALIGQMPYETMQYCPGTDIIHLAHKQVAAETPRCVFVPGPRGQTISPGVNRHYTAAGARAIGASMAIASLAASAKTDPGVVVAPGVVTGLTASSVAGTTLTLSWDAASDSDNYELQKSTDGGATWSAVTRQFNDAPTQSLTGLSVSTNYLFGVRGVGPGGVGPWGVVAVTTAASGGAAPNQVTGLSASSIADTTLTLSWTVEPTATDYLVEQSSNGGSTWSALTREPSTVPSQSVTGLTPGSAYKYRVTAIAGSTSGPASTVLDAQTLIIALYDFEFDTVGAAPSAMTAKVGSLTVAAAPAISGYGKSLHLPTAQTGGMACTYLRLDNVAAANNFRVTFKRGKIGTAADTSGVLLRAQAGTTTGGGYTGCEVGYAVIVTSTAITIYRLLAGAIQPLGAVTLTTPADILVQASISGSAISVVYSTDGGATWSSTLTRTDANINAAGGVGYVALGPNSVDCYIDSIKVETLP